MAEVWGAALGAAVIGGGVAMYGANKQSKDNAAARDMNLAAQQESERQNWLRYLMTRGINPGPDTRTGEIPGATPGGAVNTKLPLWMTVTTPAAGSVPQLVRTQ